MICLLPWELKIPAAAPCLLIDEAHATGAEAPLGDPHRAQNVRRAEGQLLGPVLELKENHQKRLSVFSICIFFAQSTCATGIFFFGGIQLRGLIDYQELHHGVAVSHQEEGSIWKRRLAAFFPLTARATGNRSRQEKIANE